jgi:DNA-binding transcriptional ArsR family regulator
MSPAVRLDLDSTLGALADPTRRAILARLSEGETRVTDVAAPFDMSLNAVSKHIRVLERARLVQRRRAGREHFLTVNRAPLDEAAEWIETQRALWTRRLDTLEALLREDDRAADKQRKRKDKGDG